MAQLTLYDMLEPMGRKPRSIDAVRLGQVIADLEYDVSEYEVVVAINGLIVDASVDVDISDSDFVAVQVIPRKGVVRSIALIAVTILASTVVGPAAASFLGITSKTGVAIVSAFVTAGMSTLANAVLPPPTSGQKDGSFTDRSQTYGWNTDTNEVSEGDALPWLSGQLTITPKRISRYIETVDDKQYLHVLYAVHDGLLTSLTNVKINGNPIENYDGVSYEVRYGTVFQDPISDFDKARYDQPIGDKLESGSDWDTYTTDGNAVTDLVINLYFPNGLCKTVKSGDSAGKVWDEQMLVYAQYSSDNVTWHDIASPIEYSSGHGDAPAWAQSPFRRTLNVSGLAPDQYSVRVKAVLPENPGDYIRNAQCWLDFIQEATGDDFRLPGTALLRIKALATDQLSGSSPVVTCRAAAGSSNPSEVSQAMMSLCKIPASRIDSESFDEWTQDCIDRGFSCNIYFDAATSLREALDIIGELGRARIEQFGSRYVVIMDKPDILPTQGFLFGMGNIARNSLEIEALDVTDRANVIDYTYYPDDNANKAETRQVVSSSYGSDTTERRIQIKLPGCTSHLMAKRHAQYRLRCNRYLTLAPSWGADADALVCRVGDIVQLAHDVPRWGYSGRLVSGSVSGCVLDRVVAMVPGKNYAVKIMYSTNNQVALIPVVYAAETASLTFVTPVEVAPELYDNYSFGEVARMSKQVRLKSITTEGIAKTRKLTGVEYVPEIHIEDTTEISTISIADNSLSRLRVADYIQYDQSGIPMAMLWVSWVGYSLTYIVNVKYPGTSTSVSFKSHESSIQIPADGYGQYDVVVTDDFGHTASASYTIAGRDVPPDVTGFSASWDDSGFVMFAWDKSVDLSVDGYELRVGATFDAGASIGIFYGTSYQWAVPVEYADSEIHVFIKAIRQGQRSALAESVVVQTGLVSPLYAAAAETAANNHTDERIEAIDTSLRDYTDAKVLTEENSRVDAVSAIAEQIETVSSTVGNHATTLTEIAQSINGIEGRWSLQIDNNGHVTGIELIGGEGSGSFVINADVIINGSLTTEKIADNAVTDIVSAYTAASVTGPAGDTYQQASIVTEGEKVTVMFGMYTVVDRGGASSMYVMRDGTIIWESQGSFAPEGLASSQVVDTPPAGSHTYYLKMSRIVNSGANRGITLIRQKK